jgi:mRNA interferase RelE/StbE
MPGSKVRYVSQVIENGIPKLGASVRLRIRKAIVARLTTYPELYGSPLHGTLHPLWKLRIGDYRVLYDIRGSEVWIVAIAHRKEIYDIAMQRRAG